jgi:hypothetical protein
MRLLCVVVLAACSGTASAPAQPRPPASGPGPRGEAPHPAPDRTDADCERLIAHAVALGSAEQPAQQQLTADERTALERDLRTAWLPRCSEMTSHGYECALSAHTLAELDACGG